MSYLMSCNEDPGRPCMSSLHSDWSHSWLTLIFHVSLLSIRTYLNMFCVWHNVCLCLSFIAALHNETWLIPCFLSHLNNPWTAAYPPHACMTCHITWRSALSYSKMRPAYHFSAEQCNAQASICTESISLICSPSQLCSVIPSNTQMLTLISSHTQVNVRRSVVRWYAHLSLMWTISDPLLIFHRSPA